MQREELVLAMDCCNTYNLEYAFISWLNEHELIEVHVIEEEEYIPYHQLSNLEQFIRLHEELGINLEGIEAISHLLQRVQTMQQELNQLNNKLREYERELQD